MSSFSESIQLFIKVCGLTSLYLSRLESLSWKIWKSWARYKSPCMTLSAKLWRHCRGEGQRWRGWAKGAEEGREGAARQAQSCGHLRGVWWTRARSEVGDKLCATEKQRDRPLHMDQSKTKHVNFVKEINRRILLLNANRENHIDQEHYGIQEICWTLFVKVKFINLLYNSCRSNRKRWYWK